jgi:hypothetical protein
MEVGVPDVLRTEPWLPKVFSNILAEQRLDNVVDVVISELRPLRLQRLARDHHQREAQTAPRQPFVFELPPPIDILQFTRSASFVKLWFDNTLRLGPPSRQDETALLGPRVILVDALVHCIGSGDAAYVFDKKLRELSAFLSVVTGLLVQLPKHWRTWTWESMDGADCAVRHVGYREPEGPPKMPAQGACREMPLRQIKRPDFSIRGLLPGVIEQSLPADVTDLWAAYCGLTADNGRQFLHAAAKWQEALMHGGERSTL